MLFVYSFVLWLSVNQYFLLNLSALIRSVRIEFDWSWCLCIIRGIIKFKIFIKHFYISIPLDRELATIFVAEILATGLLLFMGCAGGLNFGANYSSFVPILIFGLTVLIVVQSFAAISGAHLNPAVTVAALMSKAITPTVCNNWI